MRTLSQQKMLRVRLFSILKVKRRCIYKVFRFLFCHSTTQAICSQRTRRTWRRVRQSWVPRDSISARATPRREAPGARRRVERRAGPRWSPSVCLSAAPPPVSSCSQAERKLIKTPLKISRWWSGVAHLNYSVMTFSILTTCDTKMIISTAVLMVSWLECY